MITRVFVTYISYKEVMKKAIFATPFVLPLSSEAAQVLEKLRR